VVGLVLPGLSAAACGAGPSSTATSTPAPAGTTAAPSSPTTTSAPAALARCHAAGLSASVEGTAGAAGTIELTVQLRNSATAACVVEGYPGLQLVGADGTELPTSVVRGGSFPFTAMAPTSVTLSPGASAFFNVAYSDVPSGTTPCQGAASLWVTPPDDVAHVVVASPLQACSGTLTVSPVFAPGSPGALTTAPAS
jgi:hypothetical protein